jgi:two-component system LytT family response regulator
LIRALIADDEEPARERLRQLLAAHSGFEVVAEAKNGAEAIQLTASVKPQLLFLDIQMPGWSGLQVAACLPAPRPAIIFCTAFDQHAVDAFELNAIDYLLKPISRARLAESLQRLASTETPLSAEAERQKYVSRFLVRNGSHYVVVAAHRTAYFESVEGLTRLTTVEGQTYWVDPSLQELESQVDSRRFFRISRNAMVGVAEILELHPLPGGAAEIVLKRGVRLEVSRRRVRPLVNILEKS